ncbi:nitroreductase family protein [Pedobacter psychrotolerans]|uniref:nitroreductase family protein n=1 Tax=Pedobacter psychrotolerans TaxID=1843235 RepID=UPI003F9D58B0
MAFEKLTSSHYAVKKYTDERVSEEKIDRITEAINLSASSCGIQPYRLIVVMNPQVRRKLAEGSFDTQIPDSTGQRPKMEVC